MALYWDSSYEIVLALMERYPDANIEAVGLAELHQMIVTLPGFRDDPDMGPEGILEDILGGWYEEASL